MNKKNEEKKDNIVGEQEKQEKEGLKNNKSSEKEVEEGKKKKQEKNQKENLKKNLKEKIDIVKNKVSGVTEKTTKKINARADETIKKTKALVRNANDKIAEKVTVDKTKNFLSKNKAILIFIFSILILATMFFYIKSRFDITEKERQYIEDVKREKAQKAIEKEKNKEEQKNKETVIFRYPYINTRGLIRFKEFERNKKELEKLIENDSDTNKDFNNVMLSEIYKETMSKKVLGYEFDKIIVEESQLVDGKIVNLCLKGQYKNNSEYDESLYYNLLESAAFQFSWVSGLKIFNNCDGVKKLLTNNELDKFSDESEKVFLIRQNNKFENSEGSSDNFIFAIKDGDFLDYKNIEIKGSVFSNSNEFLPFEDSVGEVKVYNSENVFLGKVRINNLLSNKKYLLNNKEILKVFRKNENIKKEKYFKENNEKLLKAINKNFNIKFPGMCSKAKSECSSCVIDKKDKKFSCKKNKKSCEEGTVEEFSCQELDFNSFVKAEDLKNKNDLENDREKLEKDIREKCDTEDIDRKICDEIVVKKLKGLAEWYDGRRLVEQIQVLAKGKVGEPRTEAGYIVIESYDDNEVNGKKLRFEVKFK